MGAPAKIRRCRREECNVSLDVTSALPIWLQHLSYVPGHSHQFGELVVDMVNLLTLECWPGLDEKGASLLL